MVEAVRAEQNRATEVSELLNAFHAFFLKVLIAHGQGFIDDQHLGLHGGDQGKSQAHHHARRISFDGPVYGVTEFAEGQNFWGQALHVAGTESDEAARKQQVFSAREFGVKSCAQLQNCGQTAIAHDSALRGLQTASQKFEQGAFARAVVSNHPQALAFLQTEADIA